MRLVMVLLLLAPRAGAQDGELQALLDRMEARRKGLQDFRAAVSLYYPVELKTGERDLRRWSGGPFVFRAPADAAWAFRKDRAGFFHGNFLDQNVGIRAALRGGEFTLHAPCELHRPHDGPGNLQNYPYGATWFGGRVETDLPPLVPMLAEQPEEFPVILLYDLAPRQYLSKLPRLRKRATRTEGGREFAILTASPQDGSDAARQEEAARIWNYHTWVGCEIWIDTAAARIDRMTFRHQGSSSSPRFTWFKEYRFSRFDRIGGIEGIPTTIGIVGGTEDSDKTWSGRLEIAEIRVNRGVTEEEVALKPPAGRIVRDWFLQSAEVYAKRPQDPAAWLALGALRMHCFEGAAAEKAFLKAIELNPASEEGYIGAVYALEGRKARFPEGIDLLEKGIAAGVKSDELRWELAHRIAVRDPASARRHLEAVLANHPGDPETLIALATLAAKDTDERRALCLKALRSELAGAPPSGAWRSWKETQPSEKDRAAMVGTLEEALRKEDRARVRLLLMELLGELGKKDEVRRQARAILALLEKKPSEGDLAVVDRIHEIFRGDKDADALRRLEKALAVRDDDDGEILRRILEAERQVALGTVEAWVRYFDEKIMPPEKNDLKMHWQPCARLIAALKREKMLTRFLDRLYTTPAEDPLQAYHRFAAKSIAYAALEGSERAQFDIRLRQLDNGPAASAQEALNLGRTLAMEKKWAEARAKAEEVLAIKGLKGEPRAAAEYLLARCHEAAGEFEKAHQACGRILDDKEIVQRFIYHLFRAKMKTALHDPSGAVLSYALGFEDAAKESPRSRRWAAVDSMLREIPLQLKEGNGHIDQLEAAEGLARAGAPAGLQATVGILRQSFGRYAGALEAYEKAREVWKGDPVILRWQIKAAIAAGQRERAISLRSELIPLLEAEKQNFFDYSLSSSGTLTLELANACRAAQDRPMAQKLTRGLAAEPLSNDTYLSIASLLDFVRQEEFIEEIDAAIMKGAKSEWQRFNAHYPAVSAYHAMGKSERAINFYKDVTVENGWSKSSAEVARAWIQEWEKGPK